MSTAETVASTPIEPLDDRGSAVRFESQCVVIPDHEHRSRRPRVVTKSYVLPLWKKRTSSACPNSASAPAADNELPSHLVLRLPLPSFSRKLHSTARSVDHAPLTPCLVHRAQPFGPSCASAPSASPVRCTHTPRKPSPSPSRSDIITVPLRPCCAACQSVTEAAVVGGDAWPEHFSRAASRRRSASADASLRTITVAGSAASASYGTLGVSISVDEVDKRRRSSDTGPSTFSQDTPSDGAKVKADCRVPLVLRRTIGSSSCAADTRPPPSPTHITPATPRIPEEEDDEDENELFPLPSPKRTPLTSPAPSPVGSLSSLMVAQTHHSSGISPTPSTCSGDSTSLHQSKRHFDALLPCSSSSSLSLPKLSESATDLTLAEDPPRAPSPSLLSTLPTLSGRHHPRSPSPRISFVPPTPTDALPSATISPKLPQSLTVPPPVATPPSPSTSQPSSSPNHSPTHARFPWQSKRSVSADISTPSCSPSTSPALSTSSGTKRSFSMSSPRYITDVLRGFGAMGVSNISPGM